MRIVHCISCFGLALLIACDGGGEAKSAAKDEGRARVDAVTAKAPKIDIEGFCDVHPAEGQGKKLALPELRSSAPAKTGGWQWINVWATWCKPCVEELPMLSSLRGKFDKDGLPLQLVFLSVDAEEGDVKAFEDQHGKVPDGLQIKDANALPQWLASIGLDENSALPIHLFADETGEIRCVRMGGMSEKDYDTVKGIVRGS
jgi:thiol-disulfide isomerase/thioredoxin